MARIPRQYSLATLLLLVVIVALGAALWSSGKNLQEAENSIERVNAEIKLYRKELGYLDVKDPEKIHVVQVPIVGQLRWRWRLHLPENRQYRLNVVTRKIPAEGTANGSSSKIRSGKSVLHAEVVRDHNGKRELRVENIGRGSMGCELEREDHQWIDSEASWSSELAGDDGTEAIEPGGPAVLLRLRVMEEVLGEDGEPFGRKVPPDGPSDGFMIWISEVKTGG